MKTEPRTVLPAASRFRAVMDPLVITGRMHPDEGHWRPGFPRFFAAADETLRQAQGRLWGSLGCCLIQLAEIRANRPPLRLSATV